MSREFNLISLEHNCIPATCCCDDASRPPLQAQGELQPVACTSHLTCFAFSLHAWLWAHTSGQTQDLEDAGMAYLHPGIPGMQWAPALGKHTAHAFAHARLAGMSRDPGECTLLRAARIARHRHRRPCHLVIWWRARKPLLIADLWLSRRGYDTSLSMDCKYGLWIQGLIWPVLETPSTAPEKGM
jgi:hypothetical protein